MAGGSESQIDQGEPRLTEAELATMEHFFLAMAHGSADVAHNGVHLVRYVRRLRRLIVAGGRHYSLDVPGFCSVCDLSLRSSTSKHAEGCFVGEIEAEAQAIRDE